jgi:MFS family permease
MIRSGLLAGLCGLVLGSVLGGWVILMDAWHVSWLWSVAPIPLVLLWATWWRAPDWAHENTSWAARRRAAAAVLVPAAALMLAVPWYRVYSLPDALPGFEPARYLATFTPEAKATAELYRPPTTCSFDR